LPPWVRSHLAIHPCKDKAQCSSSR
jgi:hypothetical protein